MITVNFVYKAFGFLFQGLCDENGQLLYSLYGVVVHGGGMQDGHYTAYTRTRTIRITPTSTESPQDSAQKKFDRSSVEGQWYHISDTQVKTATESEALRSQAYLLFYEQLPYM